MRVKPKTIGIAAVTHNHYATTWAQFGGGHGGRVPLIYLNLSKPTMQQCFHPSTKHLLYRYITPSFVGRSFHVKGVTCYFFANSPFWIWI